MFKRKTQQEKHRARVTQTMKDIIADITSHFNRNRPDDSETELLACILFVFGQAGYDHYYSMDEMIDLIKAVMSLHWKEL